MSKKNSSAKRSWLGRLFFGGSKGLADDIEAKRAAKNDVEEIVSPVKQIVRGFMERKLAVGALCVVIAMFLLVFIGPLFMTTYTDTYTEVTQANLPPTMSMLSVPSELKNDIKMIDSYGSFSVGLSNAGKVYVWGATGLGTTGIDVADIPEEVQNEKIAWVAAGIDHIVAVGENGKVYAWGANKLGQYGYFDPAVNPNIAPEPDELLNGTIDASNIKKITCGYQATAILMNDGTLYMWGNKNTYQNFDTVATLDGKLTDIDFTLNYVVAVTDGNSVYTGKRGLYDQMRDNMGSATVPLREFLNGRKITSIYATSKTVCALLDDGTVVDIKDNTKTYRVAVNEYCATLPGSVFENKTPVQNVNEAPIDNISAIEALRAIGKANNGKLPLDLTERCVKVELVEEDPCEQYTDLDANAWYAESVHFALVNGLFVGFGDGTFRPEAALSRAMVATVLYRQAGSPAVTGTSTFPDLKDDWYADAVAWAQEAKVVIGDDKGLFRPDDDVTREEMVTMLYRFAASQNMDTTTTGDLSNFTDASSVQSYATEPMTWAVGNGIILGMGNNELAPRESATRAQFAAITARLAALK